MVTVFFATFIAGSFLNQVSALLSIAIEHPLQNEATLGFMCSCYLCSPPDATQAATCFACIRIYTLD